MVQPGVLWSKCCPTIPFVLGGVIFQNFHSTTPATISIHFPRWFLAASPTWWSFNHDNKSESLSPEAAATCYDRKLRAPRSQIPPLLSFFLVRAESFSARGKFLNFTAHWSTFSAPWPYQHSNNSNEGKWWRKSPNPDLVMEGQGSWWSAACTGSSFLSHPNWQPESESSFSLRSLGDSTFQALIFTNP